MYILIDVHCAEPREAESRLAFALPTSLFFIYLFFVTFYIVAFIYFYGSLV